MQMQWRLTLNYTILYVVDMVDIVNMDVDVDLDMEHKSSQSLHIDLFAIARNIYFIVILC